MKMYRFVLYDENAPIMGTNVDEPNPQIDAEFWARFMEGNCSMVFVRCFEENEDGDWTAPKFKPAEEHYEGERK